MFHCTHLPLAKKVQHSSVITTRWLCWVWVAEGRWQRMRTVNEEPLQPVLTKPTKQPNSHSEAQTSETPKLQIRLAIHFSFLWLSQHICRGAGKAACPTTQAAPSAPASLRAHSSPGRSLEQWHSMKTATDLSVQPICDLHSTWAAVLFTWFHEQKTQEQVFITTDMQFTYQKQNSQDLSLLAHSILAINYWLALQFEAHTSSILPAFLLTYMNYLASSKPEAIFKTFISHRRWISKQDASVVG